MPILFSGARGILFVFAPGQADRQPCPAQFQQPLGVGGGLILPLPLHLRTFWEFPFVAHPHAPQNFQQRIPSPILPAPAPIFHVVGFNGLRPFGRGALAPFQRWAAPPLPLELFGDSDGWRGRLLSQLVQLRVVSAILG